MKALSVHCVTLGCDKNLVDSEALLGRFAAAGFAVAGDADDADIWVLNTCGFIEAARLDSRQTLTELLDARGEGRILAVTGCWSQEHAAAIAEDFPQVDVIGGIGAFDDLVVACRRAAEESKARVLPTVDANAVTYDGFLERRLLTPEHVAFLKISEGCSRSCTYCRIPLIRGRMRSRAISDLVTEAEGLVARGVRELQLVSQITSDFGRDRGETLLELVRCLAEIDGLRRIRLLYCYGGLIPVETMLEILAVPKVVPYLDMPIQHAAPALLRAMKRPGDPEKTAACFAALREAMPDLVLRTTLLLGFPGEEDEDVEELADFLGRVEFDHLGTYRYSPEEGTPAATMADRPCDEAVADREAQILDLQAEIALRRQQRRLGGEYEIVIDEVGPAADYAELLESFADGVACEGETATAAEPGDDSRPIAVGRSEHFGYDLDGVVVLDGLDLAPGDWIRGRLTVVTPFDCLAVRS